MQINDNLKPTGGQNSMKDDCPFRRQSKEGLQIDSQGSFTSVVDFEGNRLVNLKTPTIQSLFVQNMSIHTYPICTHNIFLY